MSELKIQQNKVSKQYRVVEQLHDGSWQQCGNRIYPTRNDADIALQNIKNEEAEKLIDNCKFVD